MFHRTLLDPQLSPLFSLLRFLHLHLVRLHLLRCYIFRRVHPSPLQGGLCIGRLAEQSPLAEVVELMSLVPQERFQQGTEKRIVDIPMPRVAKAILEASRTTPAAHFRAIVAEPVHFMKEIPEGVMDTRQERISERTGEQNAAVVDVRVPHIMKGIFETIMNVPQQR